VRLRLAPTAGLGISRLNTHSQEAALALTLINQPHHPFTGVPPSSRITAPSLALRALQPAACGPCFISQVWLQFAQLPFQLGNHHAADGRSGPLRTPRERLADTSACAAFPL